jgi:hypothetical protein
MFIKKVLARVASEILYYLGDRIGYPMSRFDWAWLYPVYNQLMTWSIDIQDWASNTKPWTNEFNSNESNNESK